MSNALRLMLALTKDELRLKHLSNTDILLLPIDFLKDYIISNVRPLELLNLWHRLPGQCKEDYNIRILLPCFIHSGTPNGDQIDGPPPSQKRCPVCKTISGVLGVKNIH